MQMGRASLFGREQAEHQINRHIVSRIEANRAFQPQKHRDRAGNVGMAGVGDGYATAKAGAAQPLPLLDPLEHFGGIKAVDPGETVGQLFENSRLAVRTNGADGFRKQGEKRAHAWSTYLFRHRGEPAATASAAPDLPPGART